MKQSETGAPRWGRWLAVLAILAAALSFAGVTVARYALQQEKSGVAEPQNFYFTSDFLREETENARYYIDPLSGSFQVELFNWADGERVSSGEIKYEVSARGAGVSANPENGILAGGAANTARLTVSPHADAKSVTVTVTALSPYTKTLSADFELGLGNRYAVEDKTGNTAGVLTMTCTDASKDVHLSLPGGVVPDNTDDRVSAGAAGGYIFRSPGHGVYSLVLLKTDPGRDLSIPETAFASEIVLN